MNHGNVLTEAQTDYIIEAVLNEELDKLENFRKAMYHFDYNLGSNSLNFKYPEFLSHNPSILGFAIFFKRKKCIALISEYCEIDITDSRGYVLAHYAAASGDLEIYKQFEKTYPTYYDKSDFIDNPVHIASYFGHKDILEFQIKGRFRYIVKDSKGNHYAWLAARNGSEAALRCLIDGGFLVDYSVRDEALKIAAKYDRVNILKLILNVSGRNESQDGLSLLAIAAKYGSLNAMKYLFNSQILEHSKFLQHPPIVVAAEAGQLDAVKLLISMKFPKNQQDQEGRTAIWAAIENKHKDVASYLINLDDIDITAVPSYYSNSFYDFAISNDFEEIITKLAHNQAEKQKIWKKVNWAAKENAVEIFKMLFSKFDHSSVKLSHFHISDKTGFEIMNCFMDSCPAAMVYRTAYDYARKLNSIKICRFIIQSHMDWSCITNTKTIYDAKTTKQKFMWFLINHGGLTKPNAGFPPIGAYACFTGYLENVAFVLENNIEIPDKFKKNTKFLLEALKRHEFKLMRVLLQTGFTPDPKQDIYKEAFRMLNATEDENLSNEILMIIDKLLEVPINFPTFETYITLLSVRNPNIINIIANRHKITKEMVEEKPILVYAVKYNSIFVPYLLNLSTNFRRYKQDLEDAFDVNTDIRIFDEFFSRTSFKEERAMIDLICDLPNRPDIVESAFRNGLSINAKKLQHYVETIQPAYITNDMFEVFIKNGINTAEPSLMMSMLMHTKVTNVDFFPDSVINNKYKEFTPLVYSLYKGKSTIAYKLILRGADPFIECNGLSPIIAAAMHTTNLFAMKLLINRGAKPSKYNDVSKTHYKEFADQGRVNACIVALERGDREMLILLSKYDFDTRNIKGGNIRATELARFVDLNL